MMSSDRDLFEAILAAAKSKINHLKTPCPSEQDLADFMSQSGKKIIEHLAFCSACQERLRIISGQPLTSPEIQGEPDSGRLIRRLMKRVRWLCLKAMIQSVLNGMPFQPEWENMPVSTRSSEDLKDSIIDMVILEINLSEFPELFGDELTIHPFKPGSCPGEYIFEITGFAREFVGSPYQFGMALKASCLNSVGMDPEGGENDPIDVEKRLQEVFTRHDAGTMPLKSLIKDTFWLEGIIIHDSNAKNPSAKLSLRLSEKSAALLYRQNIWSILIVGPHS